MGLIRVEPNSLITLPRHNTTWTRPTNTNCHPYLGYNLHDYKSRERCNLEHPMRNYVYQSGWCKEGFIQLYTHGIPNRKLCLTMKPWDHSVIFTAPSPPLMIPPYVVFKEKQKQLYTHSFKLSALLIRYNRIDEIRNRVNLKLVL